MSKLLRNFFRKYPLTANCIAYSTLCVAAEFSQQVIGNKFLASPRQPLDSAALVRYASFGSIVNGPVLFYWYRWLDWRFPGKKFERVMIKLILDQFGITPVLVAFFFISMSILERQEDIFFEMRQKFMPTFILACYFWIPSNIINFLFVKPRLRVTFVGVSMLVWANMLCYIKRNNIMDR